MYNNPNFFPALDSEDLNNLNREVTDDDIKMSMFSIGSLKALGPDGFLAKFYHDNWSLCSSDIYSMVKYCFTTACLPDRLNNTLIALVP